jgi:hypothetical protein
MLLSVISREMFSKGCSGLKIVSPPSALKKTDDTIGHF